MRVEIKNDVFDIVARIKTINSGYRIKYNLRSKKYELYDVNKRPQLQLALPFECLDSRVVDYVLETRVENMAKIVKNIEVNNARLEKQQFSRSLDLLTYGAKYYPDVLKELKVNI